MRKIFVYILLFFSLFPLSGQSRYARIELSPERVVAGEQVTLRLSLELQGNETVSLEPSQDDPSLDLEPSYFIRPDVQHGQTVIETGVTPLSAGRFVVGPFTLVVREEEGGEFIRNVPSGAALLLSGEKSEDQISVPVPLRWDTGNAPFIAGVPGIVTLWADLLETPEIEKEVSMTSSGMVYIDRLTELPDPEVIRLANGEYYSVAVGQFLVTPLESGTSALPPGKVVLGGRAVSLPRHDIIVQPLPEEARDTGMVGDYSFSFDLEERSGGIWNSVILTVRCTGNGNLPFFSLPEPLLDNLSIVERRNSSGYLPGVSAYSGWKESEFTLKRVKSGPGSVRYPSLSYIVDAGGVVRTTEERFWRLSAVPTDSGVSPEGSAETSGVRDAENEIERLFALLDPLPHFSRMYTRFFVYLLFIPPAGCLIFCMLRKRGKWIFTAGFLLLLVCCEAPSGREAATITKHDLSGTECRELVAEARYLYAAGDISRSLLNLRIVQRHYPMNRTFPELIAAIEERAGINEQTVPGRFLHPDVFLLCSLALLYFAAGRHLFRRIRKKNSSWKPVLILFLAALFVGGGVPAAVYYLRAPMAIFLFDGNVYTVPEENSQPFLDAASGMTVAVIGEWESFCQVKTGSHRIGWVRKSNVEVF